ncbi:hypothetical protein Tco_0356882 [Tanacetum coccineum]
MASTITSAFRLHGCDDDGACGKDVEYRLCLSVTPKKLGFIDDSCPKPIITDVNLQRWIKCDYMVTCWILNSMVTELSEAFLYAQSACELWKEIVERMKVVVLHGSEVSDTSLRKKMWFGEEDYSGGYLLDLMDPEGIQTLCSRVTDAPVYTAADTVTSSRGKTLAAPTSDVGGSSQPKTSEESADSFYETATLNSEDVKCWYIPR